MKNFKIKSNFKVATLFCFFRESGKENPVIIVQIGSFSSLFQQNFKEALLGNRYNKIHEQFSKFLDQLKQQGVKLIFPVTIEADTNQKIRFYGYKDGIDLIERIEQDDNLDSLNAVYQNSYIDDFYNSFPFDCNIKSFLLEVAGDYGDVQKYSIPEHHKTAIFCKIASDLNAFAILGFESSFLLADGPWKYWSSRELDFEKLTVVENNKEVILEHFKLNRQQIPLFHALSGFLMSDEDKKYLRRLLGPSNKFFFSHLASFVLKRNIPYNFEEIRKSIDSMCYQKTKKLSGNFIVDLERSMKYVTVPDRLENRCEAIKNYQELTHGIGLDLLLNYPIFIPYYLADFRKTDLKPIHELTLPILRKTAGIFLKNLESDVKTIKINWKDKHEDLLDFHVEEIPIVEAPGEV
jgi:hypothetical protein